MDCYCSQAKPDLRVLIGWVRLSLVFFIFIRKMGTMKIIKIFNNNVVSAIDDSGREVVVMGKGIGFKAHVGDLIIKEQIEKIFRMDNEKALERFEQLLENLPVQYLQVSNEIITYAKSKLDVKLNHNVYLTLTDHISFAIERFRQGIIFENALLTEVRMYYPAEYRIGEYGISLIQEKIGIALPEDEAASIAMHIINAELNTQIKDVFGLTIFIQEVSAIIEAELEAIGRSKKMQKEYLIAAIKFLGKRVLVDKSMMEFRSDSLIGFVQEQYEKEYNCAKKVAEFIEKKYQEKISQEEMAYLALDLKKITRDCQ